MEQNPPCPACASPYSYEMGGRWVCSECAFEWQSESQDFQNAQNQELVVGLEVRDANGTRLADGDSVIVVKDLPVRGAPKSIKAGTKVKNIRLTEGDHNIDCKIEGFGSMALKSEFVKKA
ncbi:zinc ribbon domain-containing protein YjdM [Hugenholtzia roseola]|uniref:zinc ribbon domain-containing protein YjdM n=1 Tax=Hugenholtzia roseola TaxID=1002 RepID=UPI00047B93CF|nr:zinc ribbon domain-containing protein YjdM [Hugenholtzia roseola]